MTEKLILITLLHENTPYFSLSPFVEIFRGAFAPLDPPPYGAAPAFKKCHKTDKTLSTIVFTQKYPFFPPHLTNKPVLRLSYSNTHVFPQVHVKNSCAILAFGDNLILIPANS